MIRWATRVAVALGDAVQRLDTALRTWAVAGLLLLLLALVLGTAMGLAR